MKKALPRVDHKFRRQAKHEKPKQSDPRSYKHFLPAYKLVANKQNENAQGKKSGLNDDRKRDQVEQKGERVIPAVDWPRRRMALENAPEAK